MSKAKQDTKANDKDETNKPKPHAKAEEHSPHDEPAPAPAEDPDLVALRSNLSAPGHAVGNVIEVKGSQKVLYEAGFFPIGVDATGRVWRMEEAEDGFRLVFAGRLAT